MNTPRLRGSLVHTRLPLDNDSSAACNTQVDRPTPPAQVIGTSIPSAACVTPHTRGETAHMCTRSARAASKRRNSGGVSGRVGHHAAPHRQREVGGGGPNRPKLESGSRKPSGYPAAFEESMTNPALHPILSRHRRSDLRQTPSLSPPVYGVSAASGPRASIPPPPAARRPPMAAGLAAWLSPDTTSTSSPGGANAALSVRPMGFITHETAVSEISHRFRPLWVPE